MGILEVFAGLFIVSVPAFILSDGIDRRDAARDE